MRNKATGIWLWDWKKEVSNHWLWMYYLKKQYNVGWMLNTDVGAGIERRYAAKLFGMRFSPKTRLSFFGNFNNLTDISLVIGTGIRKNRNKLG